MGRYDSRIRVTEKGQVTIPKELRDLTGIDAGTEVEFDLAEDGSLRLRMADVAWSKGRRIAERLRGSGDIDVTTDEIMALTRGED